MQTKTNYGFTLAEVLITLSIIGIVAALTISPLVTNFQETEYKAKWKKTYSTMANSYNLFLMENGGSAMGLFRSGQDDAVKYLKNYLPYAKECEWFVNNSQCWHPANSVNHLNDPTRGGKPIASGFIMKDGTYIGIINENTNCALQANACSQLSVDVNGLKGPNTWGKDIFGIFLLKDRILPWGPPNGYWEDKYCIQPPNPGWDGDRNTGGGCSSLYLQE
jgi:prepilin-type N-terminal cleavage/methylation domain-containing protein